MAFRLQENRWNGTIAPQLVVRRVFDSPDGFDELRDWLVEQFVACLVAGAGRDAQTAAVVGGALALESAEGPIGTLVRRVLPVLGDAGHLL